MVEGRSDDSLQENVMIQYICRVSDQHQFPKEDQMILYKRMS